MKRRVAAFAKTLGLPIDSPKVKAYSDSLYSAEEGTFFCAECVWIAAISLLRCCYPSKVTLEEALADASGCYVLLGLGKDEAPHAVGVREGMIYDSLSHEATPKPFTKENVDGIYGKLFGVFKFKVCYALQEKE